MAVVLFFPFLLRTGINPSSIRELEEEEDEEAILCSGKESSVSTIPYYKRLF